MMTTIKTTLAALALMALPMTMCAQDKLFTLEDLNFGGKNYHNMQPKNMWLTWWGDQLIQTDVEECYTIDAKTGKKSLLFTLDQINEWAESDHQERYVRHLMNATFPYPDQPIVSVGNRHAVLHIDFKKHNVVWQDSISGQTANDWNSVSKATAYIEGDQLYIVDQQGKKHQLTTDGSREIIYGQSVHRNEFGIEKGTFWSHDGKRLAFYRMDQSMVTDYPQVDVAARSAAYEPDKYPMAGMTSHQVTVGVYDLQNGKTIYLQAGDPTDRYFTNIAWGPDNKTIYMFELNRAQNDCRLVSYDAVTGQKMAELYRETSDKYVEPLNPIQFLPWDDNQFVMQSQKDGYNHLYLFNTKGEEIKQLTKGQWVVMEMLGFNQKQKTIIFKANKEHPLHHRLYSVSMKGEIKQLETVDGVHNAILSPSGNYLIDRFSTPTRPRVIDVVDITQNTPRHTTLLEADDPWAGYKYPIFECGSIKAADGVTDLYYRMVKPADFDPAKKYPTVVYVYGGPHANNIQASWHWASRSWETYMAQKGYIVFILDNRGSQYRGRDFEQATFHQLGQIEMQDQMKGVEYLKTLPYIDMNRLGVHGWSFGGFMTISLMTNYPDVFKVGVAGGPVIDWKWYEVMYGERYMGTPQNNPDGYAKTSLIDKAKNLKGRLQIITGYNDATVVPQHCLSFLDACVKAGTQPDFFAYPGEEHNMRGHASVHLHERITRYFEDYLK
ncbi:MAG: DPP IV N-terminal domain-containing protein [Prevotella sp.]|jgi:dipeptidyl-peptidase-4|nr:DPP IV N-terminal domain-containing protein [Prevotella sp.]